VTSGIIIKTKEDRATIMRVIKPQNRRVLQEEKYTCVNVQA